MTTPNKVTIYDIATAAGVSHSTVSRALNNHPAISQKTKHRIQKLAREMGYIVNHQARALTGGKTGLVGVMVGWLSSEYHRRLVFSIEHSAFERGYDTVAFLSKRDDERRLLERAQSGIVDGLIFLLRAPASRYDDLFKNSKIPIVLIGSEMNETSLPLVSNTNRQGAYNATQHLIDLGHRRIAHMGLLNEVDVGISRREGYKAALQDAGLPIDNTLIVEGGNQYSPAYENTLGLLDLPEPPTAIFCSNDYSAYGVMDAAKSRGLSIPDNLSIVGFDDEEPAARTTPPLTTVSIPLEQIGREASRLLFNLIDGVDTHISAVTLSTRLVVRETTAPPRHVSTES